MKTVIQFALVASILTCLAGCTTMSRSDKAMLRELEGYGISPTEQELKHPALAGGLNLLPGFGNFYLGIGTDESEQWLYGALNLLLWPASILWGIPEAVINQL